MDFNKIRLNVDLKIDGLKDCKNLHDFLKCMNKGMNLISFNSRGFEFAFSISNGMINIKKSDNKGNVMSLHSFASKIDFIKFVYSNKSQINKWSKKNEK